MNTLAGATLAKLRGRLAGSGYDALLLTTPANVQYVTGYRSVAAAVHGRSTMAALVTESRVIVVGSVADSAPAFDFGLDPEEYLAYGRFYFESGAGPAQRPTELVDQHPDRVSAVAAAVDLVGVGRARIGLDLPAGDRLAAELAERCPNVWWADAAGWTDAVRATKLPAEIELLQRSARLAEDGILAALRATEIGVTEGDLAAVVAGTMVAGGGEPRFVVVTSGPRSALADAYATDRAVRAGDLLRFDVGCTVDGYWSDIGRTAVLGRADDKQRRFYDALLAGEQAQLDRARPGEIAGDIFDLAVGTVQDGGGPDPYRRQHCGHGIGLSTYEKPIIAPGDRGVLEPGMVFCFETPYYELGWGGMMVEDTLVVTEDGVRMLTGRGRELTEVPA